LPPLEDGDQAVITDALSPGGTTYAAQAPDLTIRLWDAFTGRLKATLRNGHGDNRSIRFSPDGSLVAVVERRETVDRISNTEVIEASIPWWGAISLVAEKSDDGLNTVQIWNTESGRARPSLAHRSNLTHATFGPDGKRIVTQTVGTDSGVAPPRFFLWDTANGRLIAEYPGLPDTDEGVSFSPDGRFFALSVETQSQRIVDAEQGQLLYTLEADAISFSHSGKEIATFKEGALAFHHAFTGRSVRSGVSFDPVRDKKSSSLKYSPDDRYLIWADGVRSLATGRKLDAFGDSGGWDFRSGSPIAVSADGRRAIDTSTLLTLPRPDGRRFHPAVVDRTVLGRLFEIDLLWDVRTELPFAVSEFEILDRDIGKSREGLVRRRFRTSSTQPNDPEVGPVAFLPRATFVTDPNVVELWAEVLTRSRLVDEIKEEALTEAEWEDRRRRLVRALPKSPSPLLTEVAFDQKHWLREEARQSVLFARSYGGITFYKGTFNAITVFPRKLDENTRAGMIPLSNFSTD